MVLTISGPFSIPIHSKRVPKFLDEILDKKITGVALNCLQKLVDWLANLLYFPYSQLQEEKMERVHFFSDGKAKLIDCTAKGIGTTRKEQLAPGLGEADFIMLKDRRVDFNENVLFVRHFSERIATRFVVIVDCKLVSDDPERNAILERNAGEEGCNGVKITEWLTDGSTNAWTVDLHTIYQRQLPPDIRLDSSYMAVPV